MDKENQYALLPAALLPWFRENARDLPWRRDREPYHVWISEIMLQQTRVEAVRGYYLRFLEALPALADLAEAEEDRLLKLWEGLGYYTRARNLQKAARQIISQHGGEFPRTWDDIRALPGVGPYTAGAIASICFGEKRAAVDGNVLRVLSRLTACPESVDLPRVKREMQENLEAVYPDETAEFTQALMELGATVCTPRTPRCAECPCAAFCLAGQSGTAAQYPVRSPKREKKVARVTVYLLQCGDRLAICRRAARGLLAGLWQFPNEEKELSDREALLSAEALLVRPQTLCRRIERTHVFTHIRWEMTGYHILCDAECEGLTWADAEELKSVYALPTAFRQFLPAVFPERFSE